MEQSTGTVVRQGPVSSWPASLLPSLTLVALLAGGAAATATASDNRTPPAPVVEMTVTTTR